MVITVPPGGPTCFQVCAGAAVATVNATATAPSHLPFIGMPFSQSAEALSIPEFREIAVLFLLFDRTDFGPSCPVVPYWYDRWTKNSRAKVPKPESTLAVSAPLFCEARLLMTRVARVLGGSFLFG